MNSRESLTYRYITAISHFNSHLYISQKHIIPEHASRIDKYYIQGNIELG